MTIKDLQDNQLAVIASDLLEYPHFWGRCVLRRNGSSYLVGRGLEKIDYLDVWENVSVTVLGELSCKL